MDSVGAEQGERLLAILQLAAELGSGIQPENLSPDFIAKAIAVRDESPDTAAGYVFAYTAAWYKDGPDKAAQLLETCLEYSQFSAPVMREALRCSAAVFQGRKRNRIDLAEQWLLEIPAKTLFPGLRLQAESAILEAQGNIEGALKKLDEVETALMTIHDGYQRSVSLRSMQRWTQELLKKTGSRCSRVKNVGVIPTAIIASSRPSTRKRRIYEKISGCPFSPHECIP